MMKADDILNYPTVLVGAFQDLAAAMEKALMSESEQSQGRTNQVHYCIIRICFGIQYEHC